MYANEFIWKMQNLLSVWFAVEVLFDFEAL